MSSLSTPAAQAAPIRSLTRDLLTWISREPRTYAEAMEAWRSSCPRLTIWEDALADGLVQVENRGTSMGDAMVILTHRGRALLDGS
ncbi:MAG: hypothetical protein IT336_14325 [Thermomicrobiales bacterium]|nr:hypothetical protein [Thermomicrobiales bacterium]